jgi:hypothetical protein
VSRYNNLMSQRYKHSGLQKRLSAQFLCKRIAKTQSALLSYQKSWGLEDKTRNKSHTGKFMHDTVTLENALEEWHVLDCAYIFGRFQTTSWSLKNALFWGVMSCGSSKSRHFRGTYCLHHKNKRIQRVRKNVSSKWWLLLTLFLALWHFPYS